MLFDDTGISGLCLDFTVSSYGIDWISTQKSHIAVNIANYRELSRIIANDISRSVYFRTNVLEGEGEGGVNC